MASLVEYESTTKVLSINGTIFDLNLYRPNAEYTGVFQENPLISVRSKIATIFLGGDVTVSDYYDGENNQYKLLSQLDDDEETLNQRITVIENILRELKTKSQTELKKMIPNANANVEIDGDTFTKFLSVVMLATKILTGVLILQKVSKAACQLPQKQERQVDIERKIASLEEFLKSTSSLLFKMDTIPARI